MKKQLLFLLALCLLGVGSVFAQNDIARGDVAAPTSTVSCSKAIRRVAASGSSSNFKKYHNAGGLTELDIEDDAAYRNWGEGWPGR